MSEFKEETNLYEDICKQINELTPEELEQVNGGEELYDPPYAPDPPQIHGGPHHMGPGMIGPINISQDDI